MLSYSSIRSVRGSGGSVRNSVRGSVRNVRNVRSGIWLLMRGGL